MLLVGSAYNMGRQEIEHLQGWALGPQVWPRGTGRARIASWLLLTNYVPRVGYLQLPQFPHW